MRSTLPLESRMRISPERKTRAVLRIIAAKRVHLSISSALQAAMNMCRQIVEDEGRRFVNHQSGHNMENPTFGETKLALTSVANKRRLEHWITFRAEAVGNELVISATYRNQTRTLSRTNLENPAFDNEFKENARKIFYEQMADVI